MDFVGNGIPGYPRAPQVAKMNWFIVWFVLGAATLGALCCPLSSHAEEYYSPRTLPWSFVGWAAIAALIAAMTLVFQ